MLVWKQLLLSLTSSKIRRQYGFPHLLQWADILVNDTAGGILLEFGTHLKHPAIDGSNVNTLYLLTTLLLCWESVASLNRHYTLSVFRWKIVYNKSGVIMFYLA